MKKAFKFLFSFLFGILLLEILLRFFWLLPVTAKGAYLCRDDVADHSHYKYGIGRMRSKEFNVVLRMNNIGMRDDDVSLRKKDGVKRILMLGDSFMEGWGCERGEIFTDRLETELNSAGINAEVVSAGVASWSPLTELAWLRKNGLPLEPDIVVLALDATDPSGDSFYAHRLERDSNGRPLYIRSGKRYLDIPKPVHDFLSERSFIYRYLDRWLTKKFPLTEWDYGFWSDSDDVWAPLRSETEIPQPLYESYWKYTEEALRTMRDILNEKKIPFLVIMYPAGVEVDSSCWMPGRHTAKFKDGLIFPRRFDYMNNMAERDSIPYFSLLETFKSDSEPVRLFYPYDGHWTKYGHELAAKAVAERIVNH
ncbi:TPA: hypothetical protein DEF17_04490 [bacterium]|nr:MAG: hypothetical protein AUJ18_02700 [Candidatus Hydrogenedentes bacterium CG1_02_42_14]HBW47173.1 hypothetical protein [bacterium]